MKDRLLIHRYMTGEISNEDLQRLNELLAVDPELRREFILEAATDASLREAAVQRAAEPSRLRDSEQRPKVPRHLFWVAVAAIAAVMMLALGLGFRETKVETVAELVASEHAAWESTLPTTPSSQLVPGILSLKSGVATIRFHSGAEVLLEAPAQFELLTAMRGRLHDGAAVVEVPESAIGFVIETPDGYAVDYGTRFAVKVDRGNEQSDFELLEGEIVVHHPGSGEEIRLNDAHEAAVISEHSVDAVELSKDEEISSSPPAVVRLGTRGRSTSVLTNNKRHKFIDPEVLSVKRTNNGKWDYRSIFAFDLSSVDIDSFKSTRLRLNLVPSSRGFATRLPVINRFGVYGLTNSAKEDWKIDSTWEESPAPKDGVLLGTFEIPRSQQRGTFGISTPELHDFLRENRGKSVTIILVRETTQIPGEDKGLTHMFASDTHPEAVGPLLELSTK